MVNRRKTAQESTKNKKKDKSKIAKIAHKFRQHYSFSSHSKESHFHKKQTKKKIQLNN